MKNPYSVCLFFIMLVLVFYGGGMLYFGKVIGLLLFIPGILIFLWGWKKLSPASPRQVGLITFFGVRTHTIVKGTVFVLDWFPLFDIVGVHRRILTRNFVKSLMENSFFLCSPEDYSSDIPQEIS